MALPVLDFTKISTEANCAKTAATQAVGDGLKKLKGKLDSFTSGPDGIFTSGATLASGISADVNALVTTAKTALGNLEKNVISLRGRLATAVLRWQTEGEEAAQKEFDSIKNQFPAFKQDEFVSNLQKPGFSFCSSVKEQTVSDGSTTPKDIPDAVPPPSSDAEMDSLPDLATLPAVTGPTEPAPKKSSRDSKALAKAKALSAIVKQ